MLFGEFLKGLDKMSLQTKKPHLFLKTEALSYQIEGIELLNTG